MNDSSCNIAVVLAPVTHLRFTRPILVAALWLASCAGVMADPLNGREPVDDVFYHFMPIAFRDSSNDAQRFGDFNGMTAALDYLQNLGVTAIWMNPIFPSPAYHGYQHGRADQINTAFGSEAEFLNFVQQAHARGIKVFVDLVVYGISQSSTWFQSAYNNPASPYDNWLAFTNAANTSYLGSVYNSWNGAQVGFIHWNLNDVNPRTMVTDWSKRWLDPNQDGDPSDGIDGYRLDHVWENYNSGPNGWGYNLDDFWMPWHAALRSVNPSVFTFAEQADWGLSGATLMPAFGSAFTKPWEFAVRSALSSELSAGLYSTMATTLAQMPPERFFLGIVGDHDVDRFTSSIGGNLTKARLGAAILMTGPFPPIIYSGDEIGMLGTKQSYGSDADDIPMREPFKWNAVAGPPMSNYFVLNSAAYNNRFSQNNDGRSVQEQEGVAGSLLETYRTLIAARKDHVALRRGTYVPVTNNNNRVWSFLRHAPGQETLLVVMRVRNTSSATTFNLANLTIPGGTTTVTDILTGQTVTAMTDANKASYSLTLGAYSFRIFSLNASPASSAPAALDGLDVPATLGPCSLAATQNTPTPLGDNINELDQLFVRPETNGLSIGVTGNMTSDGTGLVILLDTVAGGQNVLNLSAHVPPPNGPQLLTGMKLDAGFVPDHLIFINLASGNVYVDQFTLPTTGATVKTYRGQGTENDGDALLSGGVNPNNMQVAMHNNNAWGITADSVSAAATARHGFDLFVPFADVGLSSLNGSVIRVAAFLLRPSGEVTPQWLPGTGGPVSPASAPDMTAVPGDQFALITLARAGDINLDQAVNATDLPLFVNVLLGQAGSPQQLARSDMNHDGAANGDDIDLFIRALLGGC